MEGALYDQVQLIDINGFLVKIPRPGRDGMQRALFCIVTGSNDHLGIRLDQQHFF
jgi:hypothetical protein